MPIVKNRLREVLRKHSIFSGYELAKRTGLAPNTCVEALENPYWVPNAKSLKMICSTFNLEPGDWLYLDKEEN